ncbi:MAG: T9SS type A sorting domain-containing protein [Crocinitomicaceae bacterium]
MKSIFLFTCIFIFFSSAFSQQNCSKASDTYLYDFNQYYGFWDEYYSIRPVVKIGVNFVVFQDQYGLNNYKDTITDKIRLNNVLDQVNNTYMYNTPPSDPIILEFMGSQVPVPFLPSTKIQFHLDSIYYYQDSAANAGDFNLAQSIHLNSNPSAENFVNIYIINLNIQGASGVATEGQNKVGMDFRWMPDSLTSTQQDSITFFEQSHDHSFATVLTHELGHFLGLYHTYIEGGGHELQVENDPEYLGDVFNYGINNNFPHLSYWNCPTDSNYIPTDTIHNFSCTNNIMGGTNTQVYFSPMQIYRMHKRLSLDDRFYKYIVCEDYGDVPPIEIFSYENWDFPIRLFNPIRVKTGTNLELNCELIMSTNQKIIVEKGARLTLNGGKITSSCGLWDGIELEGENTLHQIGFSYPLSTATQPQFLSQSDAILENATIAIKTYATDSSGNIRWNTFGGVFKCDETHFLNNWRSLVVMGYQNYDPDSTSILKRYEGEINRSEFNWDSTFRIPDWIPQHHISIWNADGIRFKGCSFKNDFFDAPNTINRLIGINTIDASIFLDHYVVNPTSGIFELSSFSNLNAGIKSSSPSGLDVNTIQNTIFTDDHIGVYLLGSEYTDINRCTFNVPEGFVNPDGPTANEGGQGIRLEGSSSINIEENTFSFSGNQNGSGGSVGIYSINADPLAPTTNTFYRNTFSNLQRSVQLSNGYSPLGNPNPYIGNIMTQIDCNTFNDSAIYYNSYYPIYKYSGALGGQGICNPDPADPQVNLFQGDYDISQGKAQVVNFGDAFPYNTYPFASTGIDTMNWWGTGASVCNGTPPYSFNDACPTNYPTGPGNPGGPGGLGLIIELQTLENEAVAQFLSPEDEDELILLILAGGNAYTIEQALLEKSPYLTDRVLKSMVQSAMPNYRKNNILQPQYPVSDDVIEAMLTSPYPITPYITRDALVQGAGVQEHLLIQFFKDETQPSWAIAEVAEANSPLTDSEMLAILSRTQTLEPYRLWKFLQWNTPVSSTIMNAILSLDPPTADWVINKLNTHDFIAEDPNTRHKLNKNALQILNEELLRIKSKKWYYMNKEIRSELDLFDFSAIKDLLQNDLSLEAQVKILPLLLQIDSPDLQIELAAVQSLAQDLLTKDPKDERGIALYNIYNYYSMLSVAQQNTGGILNLDEGQISQLVEYAENKRSLHGKAKALLNFYETSYDYHEMEPMISIFGSEKKSMVIEEEVEDDHENTLVLYPNPNKGNFVLSGKLGHIDDELELRILDLTGRIVTLKRLNGGEIQEFISLKDANGTYLYELRNVNEILQRGKFVVQN